MIFFHSVIKYLLIIDIGLFRLRRKSSRSLLLVIRKQSTLTSEEVYMPLCCKMEVKKR